FQARDDARFVYKVEQVIDQERPAARGHALVPCPVHVTFSDVATPIRAHGQQLEAAITCGDKHSAVAPKWRNGHIHAAMVNLPNLGAREWFISNRGHGARTNQERLAIDLHDCRRSEGFLKIAILRAVVDSAIFFPDRLTTPFV